MNRHLSAPLCLAAAALAGGWLFACSSDIYVERVGAEQSAHQLGISALTSDRPSTAAHLALNQLSLITIWEEDPRAALEKIHGLAVASRSRFLAFALAELSFLAARELEDADLYLSSACWAWFCLFDAGLGAPFHSLDPRTRLSCEIYNRALAEALKSEDGDSLKLSPGERPILGGQLRIDVDLRRAGFDLMKLSRFLPANEYEVHGLANRYRQPGVGVALIAARPVVADPEADVADFLRTSHSTAANCLLRLEGGVDELVAGSLGGVLQLHQPALDRTVRVGDQDVPLEYDISANIAFFVQDSHLFDLELPEILGGQDVEDFTGLYVFRPYEPGRIPVVFVHGTASSLARWAAMANDLFADPVIAGRVQPWFFTYRSGEPVPLSAHRLKTALQHTRAQLDPEGQDAALDQMLVIGHSQGGLLTRHLVADDSERTLWNSLFSKPLEQLELEPETRELARKMFFSEPLPFVSRVVYISTPHRGSFLADLWIVRLLGGLIHLPKKVARATSDLVLRNKDALRGGVEDAPTSLLGQRTTNPYLAALAALSVRDGTKQHCIAAIDGDDEPPEGNDGVVEYTSAALPGVDSLFLVRDFHSCQSNPHVIQEVRRILHEHLAEADRKAALENTDG